MSVANVYYAQPLLDALAHDFNLAQAAVGGVITAAQIGSAVALIFLVPLGDRLPRRPLMLAQLAALVVALAGVSAAQSIVQLLIGMLLVGLLGTAMTQGLIAYAATAASASERGRVVGAAQGGVVMGLLLARVLAGGIADLASWRMVYATSAALMILLAVALWRCLPLQAPPAHGLRYPQLVVSMFSVVALLLLAASWLPLYFAAASLWALVIGVLVLDLAGQAIHVTNQSLILRSGSEAHSRLIGGYMLFYALGSGVGAMASTWAYAHGGWPAVCALGAGLSAVAGLFWALTKPLTQVDATATLTACNGVGRA